MISTSARTGGTGSKLGRLTATRTRTDPVPNTHEPVVASQALSLSAPSLGRMTEMELTNLGYHCSARSASMSDRRATPAREGDQAALGRC